jgi:hypothetical protein
MIRESEIDQAIMAVISLHLYSVIRKHFLLVKMRLKSAFAGPQSQARPQRLE